MNTFSVDFSHAEWHKASFSDSQRECVEVAHKGGALGVRDSKNPAEGLLVFAPTQWQAFLSGVRGGDFA